MARGDGRVWKRPDARSSWWIQFSVRGRVIREAGGRTEKEARRRLRERLRQVCGGQFLGLESERLTVDKLLDGYLGHLRQTAKSPETAACHAKPVRAALGFRRVCDLATGELEQYQQERLAAGKAPQTVDHELGALRAALRLAKQHERIGRVPHVPMFHSDNRREGFFEEEEFRAVLAHLPEPVSDVALFAYLSGWRRGEVVPLRWEHVDRREREVRLTDSKNGRGRILPLVGELWDLMERRSTARQCELPSGETALSPLVFHGGGRPVGDFRKVWAAACVAAGVGRFVELSKGKRRYEGRIFHDLRRTAVRDMVRAGTSQSVAMSISGHRTISVFLRYDIASTEDQREALRRTQARRTDRARKVAVFRENPPG